MTCVSKGNWWRQVQSAEWLPCRCTPLPHVRLLLGLSRLAPDGQFGCDGRCPLRPPRCSSLEGWFCNSLAPAAGTVRRRSPLPAIARRSPVLRRGKTRPLKSRRKLPRRLVRPRHSQELRRTGRRLRTLGRSLHQLRSPVMPLMNSRPRQRRELLRERQVHKQPLALLAAWAMLWFLRFVSRVRSQRVKRRRYNCNRALR